VTMPDIDGWHVRDLISPLFFDDNTELHNLIRRSLILPYLTGSFHSRNRMEAFAPSSVERFGGAVLLV
jgi:hypothetical protein